MNMLSRKISRAKWNSPEYLQPKDIGADAITSCLRTTDNTLSFWRCEEDDADIKEVALAFICNMDRFDKIDIVVIPIVDIEHLKIESQDTPGKTPINSINKRHVDLVHLNVERLTIIAKVLAPRIRSNDGAVYTLTGGQVKTLVREAIKNERLKLQDLKPKLRKKLENADLHL